MEGSGGGIFRVCVCLLLCLSDTTATAGLLGGWQIDF